MKKVLFLFRFAIVLLLFFIAGKVAFMCYNGLFERGFSLGDMFQVVCHGLPLDFTTTAYLFIPVFLLVWLSRWVNMPHLSLILRIYEALIAVALSLITVADSCLYTFWDFKLDATVFNYLDSPRGAAASVSIGYLVVAFLVVASVAALLFWVLRWVTRPDLGRRIVGLRWWGDVGYLLFAGVLFLCIRGGVGRSTANIGMVYYSDHPFLNHSAVNPSFSLFYSAVHAHSFKTPGKFMSEKRRQALFSELSYSTESVQPSPALLNTLRPNVLLIILEGMGGTFVEAVGGESGVTPNMNRLAREGVLFTNCYANSYRTDRGTVCILSGAPSFPQLSLMKWPEKSRLLPSLARSLRRAGYTADFLYGGDINFTNMQSYLRSTGYTRLIGDTYFSPSERLTHGWGVTDRITFRYLWNDLRSRAVTPGHPWFTTFLTLASHEPWKVPYNRIPGNEKANAMAYTDDCLGEFVEKLRHSPLWKNLLVVCLPDHGIGYPKGLTEADARRYHIPMIWFGGAVRQPVSINALCNQTDLAATLLGQLGLPHSDFPLSRDVTSASYTRPFAFHTYDNGFTVIDSLGYTVYDLTAARSVRGMSPIDAARIETGKAYLQTCYKMVEDKK